MLFLDARTKRCCAASPALAARNRLSTTLEPGSERAATALLDGIRIERELLMPLRARATLVLDTTRLSVHELRRESDWRTSVRALAEPRACVPASCPSASSLVRRSTPDLLFDVRFLDNPYFVPELRDLPGTTQVVKELRVGAAGQSRVSGSGRLAARILSATFRT